MLRQLKRLLLITTAVGFGVIAFLLIVVLASLKLIRTLLPAISTFFLLWSIYELTEKHEMCCLISLGYAAVFLLLAADAKLDEIKGGKDNLSDMIERVVGWFDNRTKEKTNDQHAGQPVLHDETLARTIQ